MSSKSTELGGKKMKKFRGWAVILLSVLLIGLTACSTDENGGNEKGSEQELVLAQADQVITALKTSNMEQLSELVDPVEGVRFSPYDYIDIEHDVQLGKDEVAGLASDISVRTWGSYDGSGQPMELTFAEYYDAFIFDVDFTAADKIRYNEKSENGNMVNNLFEIYPQSRYNVVTYEIEGSAANDYMDRKGLSLVFKQTDQKWLLAGIVHTQWTI